MLSSLPAQVGNNGGCGRRCHERRLTKVLANCSVSPANGGAKLDHGSGGMVLPRRSKTLPVCQPFPMMGRAGGFTREPASREADGAVSQGPSGVPGRDERARGGAPFRGLAREREEDARVLRSAGVPTHGAGAPSEARRSCEAEDSPGLSTSGCGGIARRTVASSGTPRSASSSVFATSTTSPVGTGCGL